MEQMSKKEAVAALHKERIMAAAEKLFSEKGLRSLKTDIENAANDNAGFVDAYREVCRAKSRYSKEYPFSLETLKRSGTVEIEQVASSDTVKKILCLGTEINEILEELIVRGQKRGEVRKEIVPVRSLHVK